jgi:hypothetical protein
VTQETVGETLSASFAAAEGTTDETSAAPVTDSAPAAGNPGAGGNAAPAVDGSAAVAVEPPLEAPIHWSKEDRELFAKVPRDAQNFLLKRHKDMEGDYGRKSQQIASIRKNWESINGILEPHRQAFRMNGMDDAGAISFLLNVNAALQRDPAGTLQWLAQRSGVDLTQLASNRQVDPAIQTLHQQVAQLTARLRGNESSASEAQLQSLTSQIGDWSQAKDETGSPKYPYFEELADAMVAQINYHRERNGSVTIKDMDQIYEAAVYANPVTRERTLAAKAAADAKKAEAERKKKADEARRASFDVRGQGGASVAPNSGDSIRGDLEAAFGSV